MTGLTRTVGIDRPKDVTHRLGLEITTHGSDFHLFSNVAER